jgi:C1A family cysteine protease
MKLLAVILGLAVVANALTDLDAWTHFKAKYGKTYDQEGERFAVFQQNLRNADAIQAQTTTATFGMTQFMDLTPEEFSAQYANLNATNYRKWQQGLPLAHFSKVQANPVDWRGKAVSSVKDQGQCGSCWAFSAAEAMEGCQMLKNNDGVNVDVSAQMIVDCCTAGGSDGCNGGYPDQCINWAIKQDLATWASYTYKAVKGTCKKATTIAVKKDTCTYKKIAATETALLTALQSGPVSVCLAATELQYYTGGVISGSSCSDTAVDHAVLLAAYTGKELVVKNSWGSSWGEAGFVRLQAGVNCLDITYLSSQALPK